MKPHRRKDPGWSWPQRVAYAAICLMVIMAVAGLIACTPTKPDAQRIYEIPLLLPDGTVEITTVEDPRPEEGALFVMCEAQPTYLDCVVTQGGKWVRVSVPVLVDAPEPQS